MKIILANPRGFCAGVDRAISIVELALEIHGAPIYVRHEVVHNRFVVNGLRERGAIFVEELSEVPDGAIVIFSAHGVSQAVRQEAVRELAKQCELVVVVGSKNSSNSNRLAELASRMGVKSKLIDDPNDVAADWFEGVETIGVTAGASAPEELVQSVIARLKEFGADSIEELQGLEENMFFEVPKELRIKEVN